MFIDANTIIIAKRNCLRYLRLVDCTVLRFDVAVVLSDDKALGFRLKYTQLILNWLAPIMDTNAYLFCQQECMVRQRCPFFLGDCYVAQINEFLEIFFYNNYFLTKYNVTSTLFIYLLRDVSTYSKLIACINNANFCIFVKYCFPINFEYFLCYSAATSKASKSDKYFSQRFCNLLGIDKFNRNVHCKIDPNVCLTINHCIFTQLLHKVTYYEKNFFDDSQSTNGRKNEFGKRFALIALYF